jgi:hypothetical protein
MPPKRNKQSNKKATLSGGFQVLYLIVTPSTDGQTQ